MAYSWHNDYYRTQMRAMCRKVGEICGDHSCDGWLEWFRAEHPEKAAKVREAIVSIMQLWGDKTKHAEFQQAVKVEVDGTIWAVEQYVQSGKAKVLAVDPV